MGGVSGHTRKGNNFGSFYSSFCYTTVNERQRLTALVCKRPAAQIGMRADERQKDTCERNAALLSGPRSPGRTYSKECSTGLPKHLFHEMGDVVLSGDYRIEAGKAVAVGYSVPCGGKSELHTAGCWVTPSGGDPKESATEKTPPVRRSPERLWGKGEKAR